MQPDAEKMAQNSYVVMKWTTDGNRMSTHHMKYIITPKKAWNDYKVGDEGQSTYPGYPGQWEFVILAVGGKTSHLPYFLIFIRPKDLCIYM